MVDVTTNIDDLLQIGSTILELVNFIWIFISVGYIQKIIKYKVVVIAGGNTVCTQMRIKR